MIERTAPQRKQTAVSGFLKKQRTTKSTTIKIARILYSAKRNALAPSAIAEAISFIRSVPASTVLTLFVKTKANTRPMSAQITATYMRFIIKLLSLS